MKTRKIKDTMAISIQSNPNSRHNPPSKTLHGWVSEWL